MMSRLPIIWNPLEKQGKITINTNFSILYKFFFRKVHVTKQTLVQLKDNYQYTKSDCEKDPFLSKMNIEGFLISPQKIENTRVNLISKYDRRISSSVSRNYMPTNFKASAGTAISHRRSDFMGNGIKKLEAQLKEIEDSMEEAVEKLPLRKIE